MYHSYYVTSCYLRYQNRLCGKNFYLNVFHHFINLACTFAYMSEKGVLDLFGCAQANDNELWIRTYYYSACVILIENATEYI